MSGPFHIKVLHNLLGTVSIKTWIIPVCSPFRHPLCGHRKMHACRNRDQNQLWENTLSSFCSTFSHRPASPSVPSLTPWILTLLGCREWMQGESMEINIQLRYEWVLPNYGWHIHIGGVERRKREKEKVEGAMSRPSISNNALKCAASISGFL